MVEIRIRKTGGECGIRTRGGGFAPATWSSPEVARVHSVVDLNADRSLEFAVVQQGSAALPSPLPSKCNEVSLHAGQRRADYSNSGSGYPNVIRSDSSRIPLVACWAQWWIKSK